MACPCCRSFHGESLGTCPVCDSNPANPYYLGPNTELDSEPNTELNSEPKTELNSELNPEPNPEPNPGEPLLEEVARLAGIDTPRIGDIFVTMDKRSPVCKAYTDLPPHGEYIRTFPKKYEFSAKDVRVVLIPADSIRGLPPQYGIAVKTDIGWVNISRNRILFANPKFNPQ